MRIAKVSILLLFAAIIVLIADVVCIIEFEATAYNFAILHAKVGYIETEPNIQHLNASHACSHCSLLVVGNETTSHYMCARCNRASWETLQPEKMPRNITQVAEDEIANTAINSYYANRGISSFRNRISDLYLRCVMFTPSGWYRHPLQPVLLGLIIWIVLYIKDQHEQDARARKLAFCINEAKKKLDLNHPNDPVPPGATRIDSIFSAFGNIEPLSASVVSRRTNTSVLDSSH